MPEHDELLGAPRCLGLDGFFDPVLGGETIANAMGVVSSADALIIGPHRSSGQSWRRPGNGRVAHDVPVRRCRVHLSDIWFREGNVIEQS